MQFTHANGSFMATCWTLVLRANAASPEGRAALSDLCAAYYQPVFVFLRRSGFDEDMARDHAHSFFAHLLQRGIPGPDPERGRFRSYLLGAVKHFVGGLQAHACRAKRGGGMAHVSLDAEVDGAPALLIGDPTVVPMAEAFDREWAVAVMNRAVAALAAEHAPEREEQFEALRPWLMGDEAASHAETARKLGMSEGAVKVAVHRLRKRFRELLRQEIAQTLDENQDVEDELRYLCTVHG
ncbi:MAG: sigma-70 family RNA polymerase sigma factor [Verrucomicrobia bacterium]|nr:sigma-70 family RNA polymerase sigma factor [Verrucomicrobiota bacterium]